MTSRVVFTVGAREDLRAIAAYIAKDSPTRARTFAGSLRGRLEERLAAFPDSGPVIGRYRYLVLGQYVAIYRKSESHGPVSVVMVTEGHRDWRRMIEDIS